MKREEIQPHFATVSLTDSRYGGFLYFTHCGTNNRDKNNNMFFYRTYK